MLQMKVFEDECHLRRTPVNISGEPKIAKVEEEKTLDASITTEVLCNLASLIFGLAFCPSLFVSKPILLAF